MNMRLLGGFCALLMAHSISALAMPDTPLNKVAYTDGFDRSFAQLVKQINQKPLLAVRLDFQEFLQTLRTQPQHTPEQLKDFVTALKSLQPTNTCQHILLQNLSQQLNLMQERSQLSTDLSQDYSGSFHRFPNGQSWYRHWLKSWLSDDVSLSRLGEIAHQELAATERQRQSLNLHSSKSSPVRLSAFPRDQHREIVAALRQREHTVLKNLHRILDFDIPVPLVNISASNLPQSFPAPGVYDIDRQTFIYHLQSETFPEEHMDWMSLHENVPGHHYQATVLNQVALCRELAEFPVPMVTREGWGAYVETLGKELGLYTHPQSQLYALEWQTLRAIRVLLDIGIHSEGWSDAQASAVWERYLPDRETTMRREINRIKRWPGQVISYVYGKYLIENAMRQSARSDFNISPKKLRSLIFRLSNQPPIALSYLRHFIDQPIPNQEN